MISSSLPQIEKQAKIFLPFSSGWFVWTSHHISGDAHCIQLSWAISLSLDFVFSLYLKIPLTASSSLRDLIDVCFIEVDLINSLEQ
jgi:hypothetical protein